ncbi:MAG: 30S ribosomal protein S6 [Thermoguttaceae bacterium]|nr:30S ribosomal protein S6 [Thermoguttaceae bacterium]
MTQKNVYDGLFILDSEKFARNQEEVSDKIAKTIESLGGTVLVSRLWEERKLAYPINNHKRGTYWLTYFRLDTDQVADLMRQYRLNTNIIRFLITEVDPKLEEVLIQHAIAGPVRREETAEHPDADAANEIDDDDEDAEEGDFVDSVEEE